MTKKAAIFVTGLLVVTLLLSAQEPEQRTALVIGNANYRSSPLKNPVNDACDMAQVLWELGFTVTVRLNAEQQGMREVIL